MILVVGAGGSLGSRVSRLLLQRRKHVRAASRDPDSRLGDLKSDGAETVRIDVRDPHSTVTALDRADCVIAAVQGIFPPSRDNNIVTVDDAGNHNLIDAAKATGVGHFLFVSASFAAADAPSKFGRIKFGIEEHLKESGLTYTIVRPTAFIETHALQLLAEPLVLKRKVQVFGRGRTPLNWISVNDVAQYVVQATEDSRERNRVALIGGPDTMSRLDALAEIERAIGERARRSHVPLGVMRIMRGLTHRIHPGLSHLIDMSIAEEAHPEHAGLHPAHLDWIAPTSLRQVVDTWARAAKREIA